MCERARLPVLTCGPAICGVCKPYAQENEACGTVGGVYVDCDASLYCDNTSNICVAKKPNDQSCDGNNDQCASGFCKANICTAPVASGSPCSRNDVCAEPFQICINGACGDRVVDGTACTDNDQCMMDALCVGGFCTSYPACTPRSVGQGCTDDSQCAAGDHCASSGGTGASTCAAFVGIGDNCSGNECVLDAYCDYSTPTNPVCVAMVQVGDSCAAGELCVTGASCDYLGDETCKPPAGINEPCTASRPCVSAAFCLSGTGGTATCTAKYGSGHACTGFEQCASGVCDSERACAPTCRPAAEETRFYSQPRSWATGASAAMTCACRGPLVATSPRGVSVVGLL